MSIVVQWGVASHKDSSRKNAVGGAAGAESCGMHRHTRVLKTAAQAGDKSMEDVWTQASHARSQGGMRLMEDSRQALSRSGVRSADCG